MALRLPFPLREPDGAARGASVKVGPDGRILIPAALRRAAGLEPGKSVTVRVEGDHLVVEDPMVGLRRLQEMYAELGETGGVDDFLAQRRAMWGEE